GRRRGRRGPAARRQWAAGPARRASAAPGAEGDADPLLGAVAQEAQLDDVARLVLPEGAGERLQVGDDGLSEAGDDVVAAEPGLFRRAAGADAGQPHPAGILRHVGDGAEVGTVSGSGGAGGG